MFKNLAAKAIHVGSSTAMGRVAIIGLVLATIVAVMLGAAPAVGKIASVDPASKAVAYESMARAALDSWGCESTSLTIDHPLLDRYGVDGHARYRADRIFLASGIDSDTLNALAAHECAHRLTVDLYDSPEAMVYNFHAAVSAAGYGHLTATEAVEAMTDCVAEAMGAGAGAGGYVPEGCPDSLKGPAQRLADGYAI